MSRAQNLRVRQEWRSQALVSNTQHGMQFSKSCERRIRRLVLQPPGAPHLGLLDSDPDAELAERLAAELHEYVRVKYVELWHAAQTREPEA